MSTTAGCRTAQIHTPVSGRSKSPARIRQQGLSPEAAAGAVTEVLELDRRYLPRMPTRGLGNALTIDASNDLAPETLLDALAAVADLFYSLS